MAAVMNRSLQVATLARMVERQGIAADTVDLGALVDGSLHLPENIELLQRELGISLTDAETEEQQEERWEAMEHLYLEGEHGEPEHQEPEREEPTEDPVPEPGEPEGLLKPVGDGEPMPATPAPAEPEAQPPTPPPAGPDAADTARMVREATARTAAAWPEARAALGAALAWERGADPLHLGLGWQPSELQPPMPAPMVRKLRDASLIRVQYQSNRYTQYLLTDRAATEAGLSLAAPQPQGHPAAPPDLVARFERIAAKDPLAALVPLVAPHIHGLEDAKRAVLLCLASADDAGSSRGRVSVLLDGPPGTAKTEILLAAASIARTEVFSPRVTGPGLTVDLQTGEPGALPRAHHTEFRVVCVDEIEKVAKQAVDHTLQALEEGAFSYAGARVSGTLEAEVRFIGACNDPEKLHPAFLDRMDFRIYVPKPTRPAAKELMARIATGFLRDGNGREGGDLVREYLRWARQHKPAFPDAERDLAGRVLAMLVDLQESEEISVRSYEAVLRVAFALARLEHGDVSGERVLRAIEILHPTLNQGKRGALRALVEHQRRKGA